MPDHERDDNDAARSLSEGIPFDYRAMKEAQATFPGVGYIEIPTSWRELDPPRGKSAELLRDWVAARSSVLDVGGGDRLYERVLRGLGFTGTYESVDVDRSRQRDYASLDEVDRRFDAILCLETLEHLPLAQVFHHLCRSRQLIVPGGVFVFSTPNARHPIQVWASDVTHVRPLPYPDLYGLIRISGFGRVEMYRQYVVSSRKRALIRPLTRALARILEVDHAQGIIGCAWRP